MKGPSIILSPPVWGANTRMDEPQFFSPLDSVVNPKSRSTGRTAFGSSQSLLEIYLDLGILVLTKVVSSSRVNKLIRERVNGANRSFHPVTFYASVPARIPVCAPSSHCVYSGAHRTMAAAVRAY